MLRLKLNPVCGSVGRQRTVGHHQPEAVTLLFTDIEGSTRLLRSLGDSYPEVLAQHRDLLRRAASNHGGREVDTQGDSFFFVFSEPASALGAAAEAQRGLAEHSWPGAASIRVRIGIHTGSPARTSEGYAGLDVH